MIFGAMSISAADIHVAKDGIDALTGRGSINNPYQTISYLFDNDLVRSGDVVIIHHGVYRETVKVSVDGITIRANEGYKVVISGTDWYGSASWQADNTRTGVFKMTLNKSEVETDFTQLFVDDIHQQIARFPNNTSNYKNYISGSNRAMMTPLDQKSGFAILLNGNKPAGTNATGQVTFSSHDGTPEIPDVTFTNEAIVRGFIGKLRNNIFSYSQDGGQVTRASRRLVTFKARNTQGNVWGEEDAVTQPEGFGYVMDLSVLDYEGEWFYKKIENTLYYKPVGGIIEGKHFEVRKRRYGLSIQADDVKIENINIKAAEVEVKNTQNVSFTKCIFTYMSPYQYRRSYGVLKKGIVLNNADHTTLESCYIGHTWASGIIVEPSSTSTTINNCIIEDIGWMGQFMASLLNLGNNTIITHNTFGKSSRFHIRTTESVYTKITDNDFYGAMSMGEDAGSIMFTSTGKPTQLNMQGTEIAYNKIHDVRGIPAFDPQSWNYRRQTIVALYLEDVDNYTVHHNLVYNIKGDNYVSKRLDSNGNAEYIDNRGKVMYLGPRTKQLTHKMNYYNNTCWNYDYFLSFWHLTGGGVNDLKAKNNLLMYGKLNNVNAGGNSVKEIDLLDFAREAGKAPLNYGIVTEQNKTVVDASDHFVNPTDGNFRLKTTSSYNSGGEVISGITTEPNPALGAWEGNTEALKNRVFNAGSNLTSASFGGELSVSTITDLEVDVEVYPNPFEDRLNITLRNDVKGQVSISVYNISGIRVLDKQNFTLVNKEIILNTDSLVAGTYFLEINYDGARVVKKLVK